MCVEMFYRKETNSGLRSCFEFQERKWPKNRPKHTRKRIHQAKKNFLKKFKTASKNGTGLLCALESYKNNGNQYVKLTPIDI